MSNVNETPEVGSYISFLFLLVSAPAALKMENRKIESFAYQLHVYWLGTTTAHHTTGWPVCHDMKQGAVNQVL